MSFQARLFLGWDLRGMQTREQIKEKEVYTGYSKCS
jgi:hypothetical protein